MEIESSGIDSVLNNLNGLAAELDRAVKRGVQKGGEYIKGQCKAERPVDTGELRKSITEQTEGENGVYTSETGPTAPYGVYVEMGTGIYAKGGGGRQTPWKYKGKTRGQRPQPFMESGFEAGKDEAVRLLKDEVEAALKNI